MDHVSGSHVGIVVSAYDNHSIEKRREPTPW
jgi:hypothetical protein